MLKHYNGNFSHSGTTFYHDINSYDYNVIVTPIEDPSWMGTVWVDIKPTHFTVYCTGKATIKFKATQIV